MTDLANDDSVSATECMIAARHSTVSANAAYQQTTTSSESNRFAALGFERKDSETSKRTIKSTTDYTTTNLTQDSMDEVTANIEKLEVKIKTEQQRSDYHEKFKILNNKVLRLTDVMNKQRMEIRYWKKENSENKKTIEDLKKLVETLKEEVRNFTANDVSTIFNDDDWEMMEIDESPPTATTTTTSTTTTNLKSSTTQLPHVSYNPGFNPSTQQHNYYKTPTYPMKNPYEKKYYR